MEPHFLFPSNNPIKILTTEVGVIRAMVPKMPFACKGKNERSLGDPLGSTQCPSAGGAHLILGCPLILPFSPERVQVHGRSHAKLCGRRASMGRQRVSRDDCRPMQEREVRPAPRAEKAAGGASIPPRGSSSPHSLLHPHSASTPRVAQGTGAPAHPPRTPRFPSGFMAFLSGPHQQPVQAGQEPAPHCSVSAGTPTGQQMRKASHLLLPMSEPCDLFYSLLGSGPTARGLRNKWDAKI